MKFLQNRYEIAQLTLDMLLQYPEKLKIQISADIQPTLLFVQKFGYFRHLKMGCLSPYWLQINFFMSLFFWLFTFAINRWHRKFVTADVTAVFVNNQHGIE